MEQFLENPQLMEADANAEYAEVIEIDLNEIKEPILCAPNDPDDARTLSEVAGTKIDEVFLWACMTNIGHFELLGSSSMPMGVSRRRDCGSAPPTRMDAAQLTEEELLLDLRQGRRAHGDAGCFLVHGQPGWGRGRRDGRVDVDAQLEPPRQGRERLPGVGRN